MQHPSEVRFCYVFGGMKGVYYELLKLNQTVTAQRYQQQLIDLNHVF